MAHEPLASRIEAVLADDLGRAGAPSREEIDELLTQGYALALELEVERYKLLGRLNAQLEQPDAHSDAPEVAWLRGEIATLGAQLGLLRERLAAARVGHGSPA